MTDNERVIANLKHGDILHLRMRFPRVDKTYRVYTSPVVPCDFWVQEIGYDESLQVSVNAVVRHLESGELTIYHKKDKLCT